MCGTALKVYVAVKILTSTDLFPPKAVVTVNKDSTVPNLLNLTNEAIVVNKEQIFSEFEVLDSDHVFVPEHTGKHLVNNIELTNLKVNEEKIDSQFASYFEMPNQLSESEQTSFFKFLQTHKELFVTPENPDLGYTEILI